MKRGIFARYFGIDIDFTPKGAFLYQMEPIPSNFWGFGQKWGIKMAFHKKSIHFRFNIFIIEPSYISNTWLYNDQVFSKKTSAPASSLNSGFSRPEMDFRPKMKVLALISDPKKSAQKSGI